ncbi:hypothetical protein SAMN04489834_2983 [Microterricola viridarii]|uniref:Uncharacterized protein n=1 Tax=Microterricola viridarii TaxID=412690 RepID=A0A1H1Y616_9MICO|nr:hypothetical protein SAMN04489834_2983 [Microterricola viridarii]
MQTSEFVRLYPELFHMAADGAWPSIQAHGLLSASALVERWGVTSDAARRSLLSERRAESQPIEHPELGTVVLRDQKPIHEPSLADSLDGLSVSEWYETLNGRVFFFPQRRRISLVPPAPPLCSQRRARSRSRPLHSAGYGVTGSPGKTPASGVTVTTVPWTAPPSASVYERPSALGA